MAERLELSKLPENPDTCDELRIAPFVIADRDTATITGFVTTRRNQRVEDIAGILEQEGLPTIKDTLSA